MATVNCVVTNIIQNIFFLVQQKKEFHTGLVQQAKLCQHFHFWVN